VREEVFSRIILSTTTVTGREVARERFGHLALRVHVTLLPLDWDGLPALALQRFRPDLFLVLETELWPNLLNALRRSGRPVILANGRLSSRSFSRYRIFRWFFRPLLSGVRGACVRTELDAERFRLLGLPAGRIRVVGNLKYDRGQGGDRHGGLEPLRKRIPPFPGRRVFVAGSLRHGEAELLLEAFGRLEERVPDLLLVLAPRHPERFDAAILERSQRGWVRWSEFPPDGISGDTSVLLVDTLGELDGFYRIAALSFVGGTLVRRRGQNLLEPAFSAVPVLFGPDYRNFQEEGEALLAAGGGFLVDGVAEMVEVSGRLLSDLEFREKSGERARETAEGFGGALEKTLEAIREFAKGEAA
jgi:3-deoxy-D-manno-octulosonic-acid transferase